jgi:hypothetical protein
MKQITQKDIKTMLSDLCCSRCKNEFSKNSIKIIERDCDILICSLSCEFCHKDFGTVILNYDKKSKTHTPLKILEGPPPIDYDDVIEAHKFIRNNLK